MAAKTVYFIDEKGERQYMRTTTIAYQVFMELARQGRVQGPF